MNQENELKACCDSDAVQRAEDFVVNGVDWKFEHVISDEYPHFVNIDCDTLREADRHITALIAEMRRLETKLAEAEKQNAGLRRCIDNAIRAMSRQTGIPSVDRYLNGACDCLNAIATQALEHKGDLPAEKGGDNEV